MKYLIKFIILLFILFIFPLNTVFAGGGRIVIQNIGNTGAYVGTPVHLTFKVYHAGSNNDAISTNERLEFRIENPRPGDHCQTNSLKSNEQGEISGYCTAQQPGNFLMYVYSLDKNDESSRVYVYFNSPPTSTPTPVPPTSTPVPFIPTSTSIPTVATTVETQTIIETPTSTPPPTQSPATITRDAGKKTLAYLLTAFLLVILFIYFVIARKLFKLSSTEHDKEKLNTESVK